MQNPLITEITDAFPVDPVPEAGEILYNEQPGYKGSFPAEDELQEIKSFFGNRPWNSISPHDVFRFRHALSFFSCRAFAYYTAAWIVCSLQDSEAVDTADTDLLFELTRKSPDCWTEKQQQVICKWLTHFRGQLNECSCGFGGLSKERTSDFEKAMENLHCASDART